MRRKHALVEKAAEWVKRYPDWPNRTLAKLMHREEPEIWRSIEHARTNIRYAVGACSASNNGVIVRVPKPHGHQSDRLAIPSYAVERQDHHLNPGRIAVISDTHIPYQDNPALICALEAIERWEPSTILLNGDIWDQAEVSFHERDTGARPFVQERDVVINFLEHLTDRFPNAEIWYKEGNHEERLMRYILRNADVFKDLPELTVERLLGLDDLGIKYVANKEIIHAGKLPILHGHEHRYGIAAPVNPARGLYLRTKESALCGHHHRTSEHAETPLSGDAVVTWSVGCLCGLSPNYAPFNSWNHGFALVEVASDGSYHVENRKILRGVLL